MNKEGEWKRREGHTETERQREVDREGETEGELKRVWGAGGEVQIRQYTPPTIPFCIIRQLLQKNPGQGSYSLTGGNFPSQITAPLTSRI